MDRLRRRDGLLPKTFEYIHDQATGGKDGRQWWQFVHDANPLETLAGPERRSKPMSDARPRKKRGDPGCLAIGLMALAGGFVFLLALGWGTGKRYVDVVVRNRTGASFFLKEADVGDTAWTETGGGEFLDGATRSTEAFHGSQLSRGRPFRLGVLSSPRATTALAEVALTYEEMESLDAGRTLLDVSRKGDRVVMALADRSASVRGGP